MAREPFIDLDGVTPSRQAAASPSTSAITLERSSLGAPSWWFLAGLVLLCSGVLALGLSTAALGSVTPAEREASGLFWGLEDVGLQVARSTSAVATTLTVVALAVAGRTLTRSDVGGLLAAALVALDPALLAYGRLALPTALLLAGLAWTLTLLLSARPGAVWLGSLVLLGAASIDPRALAWGPVLAVLLLLRGNIYAAPRHLGIALVQAILIPGLGALLHLALDQSWSATVGCLSPASWSLLALRQVLLPGASIAIVPNPVTWFAGLGALLFMGLGSVVFAATKFRVARANGRLQARLVSAPPAALGRGLWLLLLAATLAIPQAWVIPFVLALALGVQDLGSDAPGFGLALALLLIAFAVVVLVGTWPGILGTAGPQGVTDALRMVPWAEGTPC